MSLILHAHPFSSYCQKVLIALYENDTPFEMRVLADPESFAELERLWPLKRMPVLVDGAEAIIESTIIIEYLALHHPGPLRLIPQNPKLALEVRFLDRFSDNYVMTPMQKIVFDHMRPAEVRDAHGVGEARAMLQKSYRWLNQRLGDRTDWIAGKKFTLADCALAPALFYADWVEPIDPALAGTIAYRQRLLARPSFARAVDEARPFRQYFPPGAPDRD